MPPPTVAVPCSLSRGLFLAAAGRLLSWDTVVAVMMTRAPPCSSGDWGRSLSPRPLPCVRWLSGIGSQFAGQASEGGAPHSPTSHSSGSSGGAHAHEPTPVSHAHSRSHAGRVPLSSCGAVFVRLPSLLLVPTELLSLCCFCLLSCSVLPSLLLLKSLLVCVGCKPLDCIPV